MHKQLMENIAKLDDVDVPHICEKLHQLLSKLFTFDGLVSVDVPQMFCEDRQPITSLMNKDN